MKSTSLNKKLNIGLIFVFLFFVHVSWSLVSPVGSSPDEDTHLNSIYCLSEFDKSPCDLLNERIVNIGKCYYLDSNQPASCDKYETTKETQVIRASTETLYYRALSIFASGDIETSVVKMRIANSLIAVLMLIIIYAISPIKIFLSAMLTWLITNIPLGFFLISSINTSSWIISFTILFSILIFIIFTYNRLIEVKIIIAVFIFFIANDTRPDTKLIAGTILVSMLPQITLKIKQRYKKFIFYFITFIIFIFFLFEIWARSNIADLGRTNPISIWEHIYRITSIPLGVFGGWGLGSLEIDMPALVSVLTNFLILGIASLAFKKSSNQTTFTIILFCIFIYLIPLFVIIRSNLQVGEWYQPRYILPLFIPLIFTCISSIVHNDKINSWILFFIFSLCLISFASSIHTVLRRYSHGSEVMIFNLNNNYDWWWNIEFIPAPMTIIFFSISSYSLLFFLLIRFLQKIK